MLGQELFAVNEFKQILSIHMPTYVVRTSNLKTGS